MMSKLRFVKRLSVMVDEETIKALDEMADGFRLNRSDTIRAALRSYLEYKEIKKEVPDE